MAYWRPAASPPAGQCLAGAGCPAERQPGIKSMALSPFCACRPGLCLLSADAGAANASSWRPSAACGALWWRGPVLPELDDARQAVVPFQLAAPACHLPAGQCRPPGLAGYLMQQVLHKIPWPRPPPGGGLRRPAGADDGDPARPSWLLIRAEWIAMAGRCTAVGRGLRPGLAPPAQSRESSMLCRAGDQPLSGRHIGMGCCCSRRN